MKKNRMFLIIVSMVLSAAISPSLSQGLEAKEATEVKGEVATDSNTYIIGPEDVLYINIWKEESMSKTVPVRMDGKISLPLVDDIQASDITPLKLKEVLTDKLKNVIDNPTVSVTVMEANSYKVFVSGQVKNPGVHRLRSETSLVQLMTMVGGFTDWADQKSILIIRKEREGNKRITVNYKKIIAGKEQDVIIKRGDMIIVPD